MSRPTISWHRRLVAVATAVTAGALGLAAPPAHAAPAAPADPRLPLAPGLDAATRAKAERALANEPRSLELTAGQQAKLADFYTPPATLPAHNGDVIRTEAMTPMIVPGVPFDVHGRRVLYRSQDAQGKAVAVSGTILVPRKKWTGKGPRPVVDLAVPTQGLADRCAPSKLWSWGIEYASSLIGGHLAKGWAVVATDYQGLGTPGPHTFATRTPQGHAVLDMARAALRSHTPGIDASAPIFLTGYSQGGGAVAAAAELKSQYAPELNVKHAFAGAPPADFASTSAFIDGGAYSGLQFAAVAGALASQGKSASAIFNPLGQAVVNTARNSCLPLMVAQGLFVRSNGLMKGGHSLAWTLRHTPFGRSLVKPNNLGWHAPSVPTTVYSSHLDDVIRYEDTRAMARRWCERGGKVDFQSDWTPSHVPAAILSSQYREVNAIQRVLDGRGTPNRCGKF